MPILNSGNYQSGFCLVVSWVGIFYSIQFSSVQLLSRVRLFVTPGTAALQVSLFITNSQSLVKLMSIKLVMPSNHLILCHPLLFLPSIFPSIRVFSFQHQSQLFALGGQSIGVSASTLVFPMNPQDGLTLSDLFDTSENPLVDGTQCYDIKP